MGRKGRNSNGATKPKKNDAGGKKSTTKPSWRFVAVCLFILSATATVHAHFAGEAERAFETADLRTMLVAETTAKAESFEIPNGNAEFWYDAERNVLVPTSEPKPAPYGFGTRIDGDVFRTLEEEKKYESSYDERKDYGNEIILVAIDETNGKREVELKWVDAD